MVTATRLHCSKCTAVLRPRDVECASCGHQDLDLEGAQELVLEGVRAALRHCGELAEAWRRGSLMEIDGGGGTRSNRNQDVIQTLRGILSRLLPESFLCPGCGPYAKSDEDGCCAACGTDLSAVSK
jgi:Zn finger protein HypA/HybF involved in hydrogenase expression